MTLTWDSSFIQQHGSNRVQAEVLVGAGNTDEETTACGWGEVCVSACAEERGGIGQK